ncbi:MAG: prepilin-type N-terminal cleavage/methylation domain-containing protein [bacterium]
MHNNNHSKIAGFTLVETLVTIAIFGIIMAGTSLMLKDIFVISKQEFSALDNIDQARRISNMFVNELRNSDYGINGSYPINKASDTELIFFSTAPKGNGTVSRVRYYIAGNTLYKGVIDPSGNPLGYNVGNEVVTTLLTRMSLGASPLFYYYDGNYNGVTSALTQPVNVNQVKFIKLNLIVLNDTVKNGTATFTVNAGATIRNLKNNLGN